MDKLSLDVSTTADLRGRIGVGAAPLSGTGTSGPGSAGAFARLRAGWAGCGSNGTVGIGGMTRGPASQVAASSQQDLRNQQDIYPTHVATVRGGALGSHPEREPEPV